MDDKDISSGERIKKIRKSLRGKVTQEVFAESIGISRNALAHYEVNRVEPSDAILKLITMKYNVNPEYLSDGEFPMFLEPSSDDEMIDRIMSSENEFAKSVMKAFAKLGDEEWQMLKKLVDEISKSSR